MSAKQKDVGSSPAPDQKFFVQVFFVLVRFFCQCLQRVPPSVFFLFCKRMDVQKLSKAPVLHFSTLCDLPEAKKKSKKVSKKKSKKSDFFHFFPHAGTVEKNT